MTAQFPDKTTSKLNALTDEVIARIQKDQEKFGDKFNLDVAITQSTLALGKKPHEVLAGIAAVALQRLSTFANSEALSPELAALDFIPNVEEDGK